MMESFFVVPLFLTLVLSANAFNAETDVSFRLFTRENPIDEQVLENGNLTNLTNSNFQMDKGLKVFIDGWINIWQDPALVSAFLNASDLNVVFVDWTLGTEVTEAEAVKRAPGIGKTLARFIDWIASLGISYNDIHIVGSSLGCHIGGLAGRNLRKKVGYITACDPSRSIWDIPANRVNAEDAKYVEVIHSNTRKYGLVYPIGTADFYPNGGVEMPGCENDPEQLCSHRRGLDYFRDSIDHQGFVAVKCNSYDEVVNRSCANIGKSYLGGLKPKTISGVYYLETNAEKPFYKG